MAEMVEMAETAEMEWEVSRKSVQEKIMIVFHGMPYLWIQLCFRVRVSSRIFGWGGRRLA